MQPFPQEANTPPVVGEYAYYHAEKNSNSFSNIRNPHWICELTLPDGSKVKGHAVHYSLPEAKGSAPFISQHEGIISEITTIVENIGLNLKL
jgi:hypothetical protein